MTPSKLWHFFLLKFWVFFCELPMTQKSTLILMRALNHASFSFINTQTCWVVRPLWHAKKGGISLLFFSNRRRIPLWTFSIQLFYDIFYRKIYITLKYWKNITLHGIFRTRVLIGLERKKYLKPQKWQREYLESCYWDYWLIKKMCVN